MAQSSGSVQWQCDRCGATSGMTDPGVVPEGWLANTGLNSPDGFSDMNDLCDNCACLSVRDAMQPVAGPPQDEPAPEEAPAEPDPAQAE